jgi:hypothetical protein
MAQVCLTWKDFGSSTSSHIRETFDLLSMGTAKVLDDCLWIGMSSPYNRPNESGFTSISALPLHPEGTKLGQFYLSITHLHFKARRHKSKSTSNDN